MIIDDETFAEIATEIREASDHLLIAARNQSLILNEESKPFQIREAHNSVVEALVRINCNFSNLEKILSAVYESQPKNTTTRQQ